MKICLCTRTASKFSVVSIALVALKLILNQCEPNVQSNHSKKNCSSLLLIHHQHHLESGGMYIPQQVGRKFPLIRIG